MTDNIEVIFCVFLRESKKSEDPSKTSCYILAFIYPGH